MKRTVRSRVKKGREKGELGSAWILPFPFLLLAPGTDLMGEITQKPEPGSHEMDSYPNLAPVPADRRLDQIPRCHHGNESYSKAKAGKIAAKASTPKPRPNMAPPTVADHEDQKRSQEKVEMLSMRLPGMVDDRIGIFRGHAIPVDGIDQPGSSDQ